MIDKEWEDFLSWLYPTHALTRDWIPNRLTIELWEEYNEIKSQRHAFAQSKKKRKANKKDKEEKEMEIRSYIACPLCGFPSESSSLICSKHTDIICDGFGKIISWTDYPSIGVKKEMKRKGTNKKAGEE